MKNLCLGLLRILGSFCRTSWRRLQVIEYFQMKRYEYFPVCLLLCLLIAGSSCSDSEKPSDDQKDPVEFKINSVPTPETPPTESETLSTGGLNERKQNFAPESRDSDLAAAGIVDPVVYLGQILEGLEGIVVRDLSGGVGGPGSIVGGKGVGHRRGDEALDTTLPGFESESLSDPPSPLIRDKRSLPDSSLVNPSTEPEPTDLSPPEPDPSEPEPSQEPSSSEPPPSLAKTESSPDLVFRPQRALNARLQDRAIDRSPRSQSVKSQFPGRKRPAEMIKKYLSNVAFNTPEKIPYGEPSYIQFLMDPSLGKEELAKKIKEKGPVETASISITREMEVTLTGEDFTITPISETKQMVLPSETTEWKWSIIPQRPGKNRVHLVVNSIITIDGKEMRRSRSFDRYIEIEVTGFQRTVIFIEDNWYLFAMGSVPLALFPFRSSLLGRNRRARVKLAQGKHDESRGIDVFVSYSSKDRIAVLRLVESLRNSGYNVWVDQGGLHGAGQWSEQIVEAINQTESFVLVCSSHSFGSHNVVKETSLASEQRKPVIPVFIDDAEIPQSLQYQLAGLQRIEYSDKNHEACMTEIGQALGKLGLPGS